MARTMSVPCRRDLACYRNDGHPGECMYPTSSGHVHKGEWCEACVQHGVTLAATPAPHPFAEDWNDPAMDVYDEVPIRTVTTPDGQVYAATPAPPALPPADPTLMEGTPENKAWHRAHDQATPAPLLDPEDYDIGDNGAIIPRAPLDCPVCGGKAGIHQTHTPAPEAERKPDLTNLNVLIGPEIVPIPKSLR